MRRSITFDLDRELIADAVWLAGALLLLASVMIGRDAGGSRPLGSLIRMVPDKPAGSPGVKPEGPTMGVADG